MIMSHRKRACVLFVFWDYSHNQHVLWNFSKVRTMTEVKSAPFGTKASRFDVNIVHPRWRVEPSSPLIGPTTYAGSIETIGMKLVQMNRSDWKRKYELERQSEIPKLLYRKQVLELEEKRRALGPGTHNISMGLFRRQSFTKRGPVDTRTPRFYGEGSNDVPGVGTYGLGGDPYAYKELMEARYKSANTVGLLSCGGSGDRSLSYSSSHLGPGTYRLRDPLDEFLNKKVSQRGPYDLTTGPRSKLTVSNNPEPGMYDIASFVKDLTLAEKRYFGKFRRMPDPLSKKRSRSSVIPTPIPVYPMTELSPASYDPIKPPKKAPSGNRKNVPFLCGAPRITITCNKTPVGPGRYDIELYDDSRCIWGAMSAFDSQSARMQGERMRLLSERLRPKNIPPHEKTQIDHYSTEQEPCIPIRTNSLSCRSIPLIG
ncbi:hypothetical protein FGIG_02786 [Fasciola gigantica]|uniref:Lymphocyte expansion molecule n=1 Tax=Fasciola gigantica TaxID=46835 RepID=A0A504Z253_FASGI|nr:hypothetical protein FGIG_02786 [Fasciola gigantica]